MGATDGSTAETSATTRRRSRFGRACRVGHATSRHPAAGSRGRVGRRDPRPRWRRSSAPAAGDRLDRLGTHASPPRPVVAREVEVPVLRRAPGAGDVEAGEVAAAGAAPPLAVAGKAEVAGLVGHGGLLGRRSPPLVGGAASVVRAPRPRCRIPRLASSDMSTTAHRPTRERSRWEAQRSFDELGRPLRDLTFCVVDLETTGGSAAAGSMITEIGAVKVRGGEVLGEFQTLVNPHTEIPPFIAVLTGITNSMVRDAPTDRVRAARVPGVRRGLRPRRAQRPVRRRVPPALRRASRDAPWPKFEVLDTAKLARRVITRDDAPNCKLSSLAKVFSSTHDAQPPSALRRPGHGRRPPRPDGAARRPRRPHPRGAPDVLRPGQHRPAPQAPPRRGPPPRPRRLPLPRRPRRASSTSAPRETSAPGSAPTSPPRRPAPGWARWSASPTP